MGLGHRVPSRRSHVIALAAASSILVGCGDDADVRVPLQLVAQAYGEAYCERAVACCTTEELTSRFPGVDPPVADEAGCIAAVGLVFGNEFVGDVSRAESLGLAVYLDAEMGRCLQHLRGELCDELPRPGLLPADCAAPTEPKVELGGACDHDFHCISGYCEGNTPIIDGACRPMPELGDPCPERACAAQLFCDSSAAPEPSCAPQRADGQECTGFLQCLSAACNPMDPMGTASVCGPPIECDGL